MAIDFSSMLLDSSPAVRLGGINWGAGSAERERLKLEREKFEEQKRRRAEDAQLARLQEDGLAKRAAAKAEAERLAALQADRMEVQKTFLDRASGGDIEGAQGLIPMMSALGMGVELEGEEDGLPRYRIDMDAEAAAEEQRAQAAQQATFGAGETAEQSLSRMGGAHGIGYDDSAIGSMDAPAGIASTDQVDDQGFTVAERVASTYGEPGEKSAMAQPAAPDAMGSVPSNVLDMGALQMQTLQRLDPALGALSSAYAEPYRQSSDATASAVRGLGLPATKALEEFRSMRGLADPTISESLDREDARMEAMEARAKERYAQGRAQDKEAYDRYKTGFTTIGEHMANQYEVRARLRSSGINERALETLTNDDPADDLQALSTISRGFGERGATSENDATRALGIKAGGWAAQFKTWASQGLGFGLAEEHRKALVEVLTKAQAENDQAIETFSSRLVDFQNDPEADADTKRGVRDLWRILTPDRIRQKTEAERPAPEERTGSGGQRGARRTPTDPDQMSELEWWVDAEAGINGLDVDAILDVIRVESGGNPRAVNRDPKSGATGLIQFMPDTARNMGTTVEEIREMSLEDQVRLSIQFLERAGITADSPPGDYAVAVAATGYVGKPDDTVVYKKGSLRWEKNKPWRPADGGDITVGSIKDAYRKKGVGASSKGVGSPTKRQEPAGPPLPPPEQMTPEQRRARIAELRKQLGR